VTEFRLLGPLEATVGGRPLALPPGKPSAVLARLLLDTGRVVPLETLIAGLWAEAPASARKMIQGHVSQLRGLLGDECILTRTPGYLLDANRDDCDLGRFERLTEDAHAATSAARRAELLRNAIALWRGPPFSEFRHEPFAQVAARRLGDLRLNALERRIEADLELGGHARVVGELEALVADEPLREPLRAALMLALYRCGRQAEALERYREGRSLLVEELGIEPGPALQELERAILRQDLTLGSAAPAGEPARGPIVAVGSSAAALLAPLSGGDRELVLVELVTDSRALAAASARLEETRRSLAGETVVRVACFTSSRPAEDVPRVANEQAAELVVVSAPLESDELDDLAAATACDVVLAARPDLPFVPNGPVLVPFGGGRDEWAALEFGAWLARVYRLPLQLLGTDEAAGRDASRTLASASLVLQRFVGTAAEPVLVAPGPDGILARDGSAIVASLPLGPLDATRRELAERSRIPVLFVRGGPSPGGLAPELTLTRFSWSLRDESVAREARA
jgi:DNA-binding SARP family transcriptional activator